MHTPEDMMIIAATIFISFLYSMAWAEKQNRKKNKINEKRSQMPIFIGLNECTKIKFFC